MGLTLSDTADAVTYDAAGILLAAAPDGSQLSTMGSPGYGLNLHGAGDTCYFHGAVLVSAAT